MSGERAGRKIVVTGIMFFNPVAGVIYQTLHYLIGLRRLGFDVYYVEDTNWWSFDPRSGQFTPEPNGAIELVEPILKRNGLGDRWAYRRVHAEEEPRGCWGLTEAEVLGLYRDCDAWLNVTGSQTVWDEIAVGGTRILIESDPISAQIDVANGEQSTIDHLDAHDLHFTFGETLAHPSQPVPLRRYDWQPTRQPVHLELWQHNEGPKHRRFTTVTSWRDDNKDRCFDGISYSWTKDTEFLKVVALPTMRPGRFELAVTGRVDQDIPRLQDAGWRLGDALALSASCDDYQNFIRSSWGEFTAARQQYTTPRPGWFSDRSACYLAAGRPVITQETGFSDVLPTGSGLYAWQSADDVLAAMDHIDADPGRAQAGAFEVAREYFAADRVLGSLLDRAGLL